jgi:type I restriction enzyme S subunit
MKSNYKKLWKYIRELNIRNTDLSVTLLLWISIQKIFIPSIANIVWTNMTTYKIVKKNQFAYWTVTSRNGDKISIALLENNNEAIVSQAYKVFEIIDENELLPEYLMMWFRRPEFDRYARYMSHGSTREVFDWDEMCDLELPVPDITKQQEIVDEYNAIKNRISLNNILINKLEETAQSIYKEWFVDFEFPDENGNPYKSSGWEMEFCSELEKEVPKGWKVGKIKDNSELISKWPSLNYVDIIWIPVLNQKCVSNWEIKLKDVQFAEYPKNNDFLLRKNDILINSMWTWTLWRVSRNLTINYDMIIHNCITFVRSWIVWSPYINYYYIKDKEQTFINNSLWTTGQTSLNIEEITEISQVYPDNINLIKTFDENIKTIWDRIEKSILENESLWKMKDLILSKMASES